MKNKLLTAHLSRFNGGSMTNPSDSVAAGEEKPAANFEAIFQEQNLKIGRGGLYSKSSSNGSIALARDHEDRVWPHSKTPSSSSTISCKSCKSISDDTNFTKPDYITMWMDGGVLPMNDKTLKQDHIWLDKIVTPMNGIYPRPTLSKKILQIAKAALKPISDWTTSKGVSVDQRSLDDNVKPPTPNLSRMWCRPRCCKQSGYDAVSMTLKILAMFMVYCLVYEILTS